MAGDVDDVVERALRGAADLNLDCSIPDRFTEQTGVTATIFARRDEDLVRISTSIKKRNGERAMGTSLSRAHPGYARLLAGESYARPGEAAHADLAGNRIGRGGIQPA